mgnify:CR=1 FL=1
MAKILNIDKGLKVDFTAAKNRLAGPRRLSATSAPQGRRLEVGEQVAGRVNDSLPPTKHFFERIGVDILIVIWEFVHNGKLTDFLALMLSSQAIYSRMEKETDLLLQMAKDNFTFIYLTKAKAFRRYRDLIEYAQPKTGAELTYDHFLHQQCLRNNRLLRKPFFEMKLKLWPRHLFEGESLCVLKCYCGDKTIQAVKRILIEFEEAHTAIALKIFRPQRNHYPFSCHDRSLYVLSTRKKTPFDDYRQKPFFVSVRIRFTVHNNRYRFSLLGRQFVDGV